MKIYNDPNAARCAVVKQRAESCFAAHYAKWHRRVGTPTYDRAAAAASIAPCYVLAREALACGSDGVTVFRRGRDD